MVDLKIYQVQKDFEEIKIRADIVLEKIKQRRKIGWKKR